MIKRTTNQKNNKFIFFFFQAEGGIRDHCVTGVQTCALPIFEKVAPKLLRTSERSVRSMVGWPSKLPDVQAEVVAPKLLRTVERSERSTVPSAFVSPRSSGAMRMEPASTVWPPKLDLLRRALSRTARAWFGARVELKMPAVLARPKATWSCRVARVVLWVAVSSTMSLLLVRSREPDQLLEAPARVRALT